MRSAARNILAVAALVFAIVWILPTPETTGAPPRSGKSPTLTPPRFDPAMVAAGQKLFVARCARCHRLPRPAEHTPEQWSIIVPRMAKRSGLKPEQRDAVLAYLSTARAK
ncbi:MAG: cytochrome c [Verrucomicrobiota bacterium]|nr:cytochrome c [Verrucomicrobiota bacterium]